MGLNAVVAFQVATATGSWQTAMGLVVLDGLVVLAFVLAGVREAVMRAIPLDLRRAISVGIGLFIALIGAVNARLVIIPPGSMAAIDKNPLALVPPVTYGSLHAAEPLIALRRPAGHWVPPRAPGRGRHPDWHRHRHRAGHRRGRDHAALGRLAAPAAFRHRVSGRRARRTGLAVRAAADVAGDGRLLRHDRDGHRNCRRSEAADA